MVMGLTGTCCPENCSTDSTCGCDGSIEGVETNPNYDSYIFPSCSGQPVGDVGMLGMNIANLTCQTPANCPIFYWWDVNGDGELKAFDLTCLDAYASGEIPICACEIDDSSNPCYGIKIGEECCIPK